MKSSVHPDIVGHIRAILKRLDSIEEKMSFPEPNRWNELEPEVQLYLTRFINHLASTGEQIK